MCKSAEANILYKGEKERDTHNSQEEDEDEEEEILGPTCSRNLNAKAMKMKRHKVQNSELTTRLKAQGVERCGFGWG